MLFLKNVGVYFIVCVSVFVWIVAFSTAFIVASAYARVFALFVLFVFLLCVF